MLRGAVQRAHREKAQPAVHSGVLASAPCPARPVTRAPQEHQSGQPGSALRTKPRCRRPRSRLLMVSPALVPSGKGEQPPARRWSARQIPAALGAALPVRPQLLRVVSAVPQQGLRVAHKHQQPGTGGSGSQVTGSLHRHHGCSADSASGTSPKAPLVGRVREWTATSTGRWAEGLLFPFLPFLLHPNYSCSISCHLDRVGDTHTQSETLLWRPAEDHAQ